MRRSDLTTQGINTFMESNKPRMVVLVSTEPKKKKKEGKKQEKTLD